MTEQDHIHKFSTRYKNVNGAICSIGLICTCGVFISQLDLEAFFNAAVNDKEIIKKMRVHLVGDTHDEH